jgi:HD-GYP domain-containing protein (c-di-GMP phosphodiesterase class II)
VLKRMGVNELTVGMFVHGFEGSWINHPFWRSRFLLTDATSLARVRDSGVEHCWIDTSKGADVTAAKTATSTAVTAQNAQIIPLPSQPPRQLAPAVTLPEELSRAAQLRQRSARVMSDVFSDVRLGKAVDASRCGSLVHEIVESVDRHPHALLSLARLKAGDEYTYMHSVAVCTLMVALGRGLGLDEAACREVGLAGMMHDLGKAAMPQAILNKPGKLAPEEFEIIKGHPRRGFEMLVRGGEVCEAVKDVCLHHHERVDGGGYPDGLTAEQISLVARMGAVCDVYDALTSDRPYKKGWDPAYALAQMATWQGHFDTSVLQSFVRSVGIYPVGSLVRMRSGRLAVVLEQNGHSLTRPRVKLFFSTRGDVPIKHKVLDLATPEIGDEIEARESPERWGFPYLADLWGAEGAIAGANG